VRPHERGTTGATAHRAGAGHFRRLAWQAGFAAARQEAAAHGLDEVFTGPRGGRLVQCSLRWIYNHMIEEHARRNGHADLIRELIDGAVSS
jgi:hypothetical protein